LGSAAEFSLEPPAPQEGVVQKKPKKTRRFLTSIRSAAIYRARRPQLSELVRTFLGQGPALASTSRPESGPHHDHPLRVMAKYSRQNRAGSENKKLDEKIDARATVE
jgi:hypothetical protein